MEAIRRISDFVAPDGTLLVICRGREENDEYDNPPWPLSKKYLDNFKSHGLKEISFEDYHDNEDPPVRRFLIEYKKRPQ
jgi:hypothetical protein